MPDSIVKKLSGLNKKVPLSCNIRGELIQSYEEDALIHWRNELSGVATPTKTGTSSSMSKALNLRPDCQAVQDLVSILLDDSDQKTYRAFLQFVERVSFIDVVAKRLTAHFREALTQINEKTEDATLAVLSLDQALYSIFNALPCDGIVAIILNPENESLLKFSFLFPDSFILENAVETYCKRKIVESAGF